MKTLEKIVADSYLEILEDRFENKINPKKYYLAYSGGKDSHLLYWFIKEYMKINDIKIVGVNTSFEIPEIRDRILNNCDEVLKPLLHRKEIKDKFGIPCFTKQQDEYIDRYQKGSRSDNTMRAINGENTIFNLNKKARELTLSGKMHRCSRQCCVYNKEKPMELYEKRSKRKPIKGLRQSESKTRGSKISSCLQKSGDFCPLFDFPDAIIDLIYNVYQIEIPECYNYLTRTGCGGWPYGRNVETELALLPEQQRKQAIKFFKESYDVKGIDYVNLQEVLYTYNERR